MTTRQELEQVLRNHRYPSLSRPGEKGHLMDHHIKALLDDLEPYVQQKCERYRRAIEVLHGHSGRGLVGL